MKIIIPEIHEKITITPEQMKKMTYLQALNEHNLLSLKQMFYHLLNINCPTDILQDSEDIKTNVSNLILYFMQQVWQNKTINLNEKFFRCSLCNSWAFFESYNKSICILCWKKENSNFVHPYIQLNNQERFKWQR